MGCVNLYSNSLFIRSTSLTILRSDLFIFIKWWAMKWSFMHINNNADVFHKLTLLLLYELSVLSTSPRFLWQISLSFNRFFYWIVNSLYSTLILTHDYKCYKKFSGWNLAIQPLWCLFYLDFLFPKPSRSQLVFSLFLLQFPFTSSACTPGQCWKLWWTYL